MSWNYRIIRYRNGALGLHEVYYDDTDSKAFSRSEQPTSFACDADEGVGGLIASLLMALRDARELPVLDDFVKEAKP